MARRDNSHPYLVLFALWLMVFSASSQVIIVSPILPRIGEALNIAEAYQGWLITSYAVFLSLFALIIGYIAFTEIPDAATLIGAAIIIASGIYTLWREARLHRASLTENPRYRGADTANISPKGAAP